MSEFQVTILGCGSALPAGGRHPSAQHLRLGKYQMLIDCGEGTQLRMRERHLKLQSLTHIFISHMHGDHYLGLMGLLFSMTLLGRDKPITIVGPNQIEELIALHLRHANAGLKFPIHYIHTSAEQQETVLDLPSCLVQSIPLDHKIPTTGFLFREKERPRKLRPKALEKYNVPIKVRKAITMGADFIAEDGSRVVNDLLSDEAIAPRAYAYCSDTAFIPLLAEQLQGVDLLYHESTFTQEDIARAHRTRHSTAQEAATVARDAGVKRLLLGHYSARYSRLDKMLSEAQSVFAESYLSEEGQVIDLHKI